MITGDLKSKIDAVWNDFWSGGISNPLEVMEQLTYLLFIKGLDESQTRAENRANRTGEPIEDAIFPTGEFTPDDATVGRPYQDLRWDHFKNLSAQDMYDFVDKYVFPFMQARAANSTHAKHMTGARLTIPTPALLQKAVDGLDAIPMEDRDTKGDVYEYMLAKIATAGQNGQFRTPRHIIQLMVEMTAPNPTDLISDPACGTCGFLVAANEYIRDRHPSVLTDPAQSKHFHDAMFHGYDFDNTMLRIGSMNMQLHGVQNPAISYRDSLAQDHAGDIEAYSLVLANPPFAGSLDYESTAKDLLQVVKTKKTELLFLALFLRLLKPGGRAAVIVPDGVLFGSTKAHKELRRMLVEDQKLDGIVSLPSGAFKPYAGVSTAILLFTKTNSGGTDHVWFYDLQADGFSLDDKRTPLLTQDKIGATAILTGDEHAKNSLPDALARWTERDGDELHRARTDQSFCVPKADIAANDYDLSINRYKEIVYDEVEYAAPAEILDELTAYRGRDPEGHRRPQDDAGMSAVACVGDLATQVRGVSYDKADASTEARPGTVGVVRAGNISDGELLPGDLVYVPEANVSEKQMLRRGDVLIATSSGSIDVVGKAARIREDQRVAFGAFCKVLRPTGRVDAGYFAHYFQTTEYRRHVARVAAGANINNLKNSHLDDIEIPLPPIEEQRRIAAVLDAADALRAKRRQAIAKLDTLTQAIFIDMFGDPARNPMGWKTVELADIVAVGTTVTYGIVQAGPEFEGGVPYIRTGDIVDGEIQQVGLRRTDPKIAGSFPRSRIRAGEIVMSIRATVGTTAIVPEGLDGANLTQGTARIAPGSRTSGAFLLHYLRSTPAQRWIERQVKGATFREITLSRLRELPIQLPPLDLQQRFARTCLSVGDVRDKHGLASDETDNLFASLQHRSFRGEL